MADSLNKAGAQGPAQKKAEARSLKRALKRFQPMTDENIKKYEEYLDQARKFSEIFIKHGDRPPVDMVGWVGEWTTAVKLRSLKISTMKLGAQSKYDFLLSTMKGLEVRTSIFKHEGFYKTDKGEINYFGWKIKDWDKDLKFDYLVCIGFPSGISNPRFFIFPRDIAESVESLRFGQFRKVEKGLHIFRTIEEARLAAKLNPQIMTPRKLWINEHLSDFEDKWDIIR